MSDSDVVVHRKSISPGQLAIIKLLYKYRFSSVELVRVSLGLSNGLNVYKKLKILLDEGYVDKHYDSSYKIKGQPAAYYLLAKGYRALQLLPDYESIDEKLIKYSYKDKTASHQFIAHNLRVYDVALQLQRLYPDIKLFTKRELAHRKHFPGQLPDAFVSLKLSGNTLPLRYLLDIITDDTPRYILDKKIADYYDFFDNDGWKATNSPLPTMLLLCQSGKFEKRLQKLVARKQQALGSYELEYFTTTLPALKNASKQNLDIWSNVEDPEELMALEQLKS